MREAKNSTMIEPDRDKLIQAINDLKDKICYLQKVLKEKQDELSTLETKHIRAHEPYYLCRICNAPHEDQKFAELYANRLVCKECGRRSRTVNDDAPFHDSGADNGDNPLFVDGVRVWRRYNFGGFITLLDTDD